jgi:hypothetical protein
MGATNGLTSAYQLLDYSAQRVLMHNLEDTSAGQVFVEIIAQPDDVLKLREVEFVKAKVAQGYDELAFALLTRRTSVQVLPRSVFGLLRRDLKILEEAGIPYELVE